MTRRAIAERVESQSVLVIECTIPADATIAEWRRRSRAQESVSRRSAPWLARRLPPRLQRRLTRVSSG